MKTKKQVSLAWVLVVVMIVVAALTACDEGAGPPGISQNVPTATNTLAPGSTPAAPTATMVSVVQKDIDPSTLATRLPLKVDATSVLKQGESAAICGVTIRVNSLVRQPKKGTGGRKDLMIASIGLENKGAKQVAIIPYDFYLSVGGKVTELSYGGEVKQALAGGPLDPSKSMGGEVAYDVAADQKDFKVLWMPGWCADKAVVEIQESAAQ